MPPYWGTNPIMPSIWADAPNSYTDLNYTPATTRQLLSKAVTVTAGDTLLLEIWYTILNNSGGTKTYTYVCGIGGADVLVTTDSTTHTNSATNRAVQYAQCKYSVLNTGSMKSWFESRRGVPAAANTAQTGAQAGRYNWQTSASNYTGAQTIYFGIRTSADAGLQNSTTESWRITQQPTNP